MSLLSIKTCRAKNFLSLGNHFQAYDLTSSKFTLIIGHNGSGKCLDPSTEIEIEFDSKEVELAYLEFIANQE
jgi:hypothetical protein